MGYTTEDGIRKFWPDETEGEFYVAKGTNLADLLHRAKKKWVNIPAEKIQIDSEYIHTDCLDYIVGYDPADHTRFLKISKID